MVASNWHIVLPVGFVIMILSLFMKPRDLSIGWSFIWGLAANSSGAGKLLWLIGFMMVVIGAFGWYRYA